MEVFRTGIAGDDVSGVQPVEVRLIIWSGRLAVPGR